MDEGICPICGGKLYEDTSRGEYAWISCDTCDFTFNLRNIHIPEKGKENNDG